MKINKFDVALLTLFQFQIAVAQDDQTMVNAKNIELWISRENLSKLHEVKMNDGHHGIWYSITKHKEITKGCNAVTASFHTPSVSIKLSKKNALHYKFIVVRHGTNQVIFDVERKQRISFFGQHYLIEKRRIGGSVDGDFMSDERFSFEAFERKGNKNYMYFPESVKVFLITKEGEVKEFASKVNWITSLRCTPPGGPVYIEN